MRLIVLLLLLAVSATAQDYLPHRRAAFRKVAAAGGPALLLQETFNGAGYDTGWTESSGTPDEDATEGAEEVLELLDGGTNERTDSDAFTADSDGAEFVGRVMIKAYPPATASVIQFRNGTTSLCTAQIGTTGIWRLVMTGGNSTNALTAMPLDTWCDIYMFYDAGSGADGIGELAWVATGGAKPALGNNGFTTKRDSTATLGVDNVRLLMDELNGHVRLNDAYIYDGAKTSSPF